MSISYRGTHSRAQLSEIEKVAAEALGVGSARQASGCFAFAAVLFGALAIVQALQHNASGAWEWAALGVLPALLFFWNARAIRQGRRLSPATQVSGTFSNEGVHMDTAETQSMFHWQAFKAGTCSADFILLVGKAEQLFAFPRSFFASDEEFASACEFVRTLAPQKPRQRLIEWRRVLWLTVFVIVAMVALILWHTLQ